MESLQGLGHRYGWVWALVVLGAVLALHPLCSEDLWWHLSYGRQLWESGSISTVDQFSWTHAGQPLQNLPWLSSLIFYGVYAVGGVVGLVSLKGLICGLCLGLSAWQSQLQRVLWFRVVLVLPLSFLLIDARLIFLRAMVTQFVGLPLLQVLWVYSRAPERRRAQWCIPLVTWAWSNAHGSFPVFVAWTGCTAVGWLLQVEASGRRRAALEGAALLGLVLGSTLLNPTGWSTWALLLGELLPWGEAVGASINGITTEAQPLTLERLWSFWTPALLLGVLGLATLPGLSWRRQGMELAFSVFLMLLAFKSQRFIGIWAVSALLYLPGWLQVASSDVAGAWGRFARRSVHAGLALAGCGCVAMGIWWSVRESATLLEGSWGFTVHESSFPAVSSRYLREKQPQGKLYNTFGAGGYLYWEEPTRPVFMDGRTQVLFKSPFVMDTMGFVYLEVKDHRAAFRAVLERWEVSIAVVEHGPLSDILWSQPDWHLVAIDDAFALYLRQGRGNDALIARDRYQWLRVDKDPVRLSWLWQELRSQNPDGFKQLQAELWRARREAPEDSPRLAYLLRLGLYMEGGGAALQPPE